MGIDFLISHDDKTKIENLCDGSYVPYENRQDVKDRIEKLIGPSIISGMTKSEDKDNKSSREVKFTTTIIEQDKNQEGSITIRPGNTIKFKADAIAEYTDIMSEMNNRRISDTYCKLEELIKSGTFDTVKIIIDEYRSDLDDSSFSVNDGVILYHLMQSKYGTIESRDQKILSDIIDKFISIYGVSSEQKGIKSTDVIVGNDNKKIVSNEEFIKRMINRKVGNYGKRI